MRNIEKQKTNSFYIFKMALVASAGGFLFGYDFVIISRTLSFLDAHFHLSVAMKGLAVSMAGIYWIFAATCLACLLFSWKMVPETKRLSLERISDFWQNNNVLQLCLTNSNNIFQKA